MVGAQPKLDQINLVTGDLTRSAEFYRRLGVSFERPARTAEGTPFHANGETASGLEFGLDTPAFAQVWNPGWKGRDDLAGRIVIGFRFTTRADVDRVYDEIVADSFRGLQPPHDAFWGARYAIVEDPNGVAVGLMSEVDPAFQSRPPSP